MNAASLSFPHRFSSWLRPIALRMALVIVGLCEDYWKDGIKGNGTHTKKAPTILPLQAEHWQIIEHLWGIGQHLPANDILLDALLAPAAITSTSQVLDLSAGRGELARRINEKTSATVTGMETNPELATHAVINTVVVYEPETLHFSEQYDCIVARELFFHIADRPAFFHNIASALKSGGRMVFSDYILDDNNNENPAIQRWLEQQDIGTKPQTRTELEDILINLDITIMEHEDQTNDYKKEILQGLSALVNLLSRRKPDHNTGLLILRETEKWAACFSALESGLQLRRFYAVKQ